MFYIDKIVFDKIYTNVYTNKKNLSGNTVHYR